MSTPTSDGHAAVPAATVAELAPSGDLRVAINLGNVVLAGLSATGDPFGVTVDLARELGERIRRPVRWITYPTGGASFQDWRPMRGMWPFWPSSRRERRT